MPIFSLQCLFFIFKCLFFRFNTCLFIFEYLFFHPPRPVFRIQDRFLRNRIILVIIHNYLLHANPFSLYYFLNTNKYSCAINKKLYFTLFVFQYPVALQLCCSLIINSFNLNPAFSKIRITSNDMGIICPF